MKPGNWNQQWLIKGKKCVTCHIISSNVQICSKINFSTIYLYIRYDQNEHHQAWELWASFWPCCRETTEFRIHWRCRSFEECGAIGVGFFKFFWTSQTVFKPQWSASDILKADFQWSIKFNVKWTFSCTIINISDMETHYIILYYIFHYSAPFVPRAFQLQCAPRLFSYLVLPWGL